MQEGFYNNRLLWVAEVPISKIKTKYIDNPELSNKWVVIKLLIYFR